MRWYLSRPPSSELPFYCDPSRVGAFAVSMADLARGSEEALFKLFVALSMFQAQRDVVVMRRQLATPHPTVRSVASLQFIRQAVSRHPCEALSSPDTFASKCDVKKSAGEVLCESLPHLSCHVKDATAAFKRTGDMGKLPTSAFLRLSSWGGFRSLLAATRGAVDSPSERATLLVEHLSQVHRVGEKLATMFVSLLSTPKLSPGPVPWFPEVDGNEMVVVDTNVARAVDHLRGGQGARTYEAREAWLRAASRDLDLSEIQSDLPRYSPRLVQEAIYAFTSRSNRIAAHDPCTARLASCPDCAAPICPFVQRT